MMRQPVMVVLAEPLLLAVHLLLQMAAAAALAEIQPEMVVLAVLAAEAGIEAPVGMAVLTAAAAEADHPVQILTVGMAVLTEEEEEEEEPLALVVLGEPTAEMVVLAVLRIPVEFFQLMDRFLLMRLHGCFRFCRIPFLIS